MADRSVLLFTKPARPGRVKTRLARALGAGAAARLHAAFQGDLFERLSAHGLAPVPVWALDPGEPVPADPPAGRRQAGTDLGERLHRALLEAGREAERVAVVGSDHPDLPAERLDQAFEALDAGADLALGPARDGGYYLIAGRPSELPPALFSGIPWSTSRVLATTLERAREARLEVALLEPEEDVDTAEDLERLAGRLRGRAPEFCPRTRAVLAALAAAPPGSAACAS